MKLNRSHILAAILFVMVIGAGCSRPRHRERIAEERARWEASLPDSLERAERQLDSLKTALEAMRGRVATLLDLCRCVENPAEVEKYYIPDLDGLRYPLTTTGLVGRMTASENLELVAVCQGASFDCLEVEVEGQRARTATVPADGALNYTAAGLTTVAFSGKEADSVAALIARYPDVAPRIRYIEKGKRVKEISLGNPERQSVVIVSHLCMARHDVLLGEKKVGILSRKIGVLRHRIEGEEQ